jgi:AraC family transcriptional regulator, positive regulator of tynA and feaB
MNQPNVGLESYQSALSRIWAPIELEKLERGGFGEFHWEITSRNLGPLGLSHIWSDQSFRGHRENCRNKVDRADMVLLLSDEGTYRFCQSGHQADCTPPTISLIDITAPVEGEIIGVTSVLTVNLPRAFVKAQYREIDECCGLAIDGGTGWGAILADFMRATWRESAVLAESNSQRMLSIITGLIGCAFMDQKSHGDKFEGSILMAGYRAKILEVIDQELENPDLNASFIARRLGISQSYVFSIAREHGTTIGQLVWEARLQRCREMIADPAMEQRSITEIAFGWGFQDLSHFSHRFSARFGLSPKAYRDRMKSLISL